MRGTMIVAMLVAATPVAAADEAPPLAELFAPLAGQCWTAEFPGGKARDTHCYRLVEGGTAIEDRHIVTGGAEPYGGISLYRRNAADGTILYHYFAGDGGYSAGRALPVAGGFDFPDEEYVGPAGQAMAIRNRLRFVDDGYSAASEKREGEAWTPLFSMKFASVGPAPASGTIAFDHLRLSRAIVRDAPEAGGDVAAYVAIANVGAVPDRLLSARCTCAARVELHRVTRAEGRASMDDAWPLDLAPGARTEVKPGTPLHLMLMGVKAPLAAGGSVPLILQFERAGAVRVDFHIVADSAKGWEG
ncbi:copper chaperone PCu(A)C [Sphingopyxis sp. KK2]|uniref:copper chaperone PCu(A)C n=1 Tax=Sphingopyxis sp. KK2 TaxID=1855727 RepID=UPI0009F93A6F|nr:copper chaperone PCu(A)C [Sphingopyxis sp. KK2]